MIVEASFVRSAARASDLPRDGLAEIALAGRSNVGKSSLINALVRRRIARTSAAPGKTRLANIYRVVRGSRASIYVVDLPGYGYARGGGGGFEELIAAYFNRASADRGVRLQPGPAAILLVDARHRALEIDLDAWNWLRTVVDAAAIVATKIDKLARGQRIRAMRELESAFEHSVLPVSAVTAEGLDELWKLIDQLANHNSSSLKPPRSPRRSSPPKATAPRPRNE